MARLVINRKAGETFVIGDNHIRITILKSKNKLGEDEVRLRIEADPSVAVSYRDKNEDVSNWVGKDSDDDEEI